MARRATPAARSYALGLRDQVGHVEASRISKTVLTDPVTFRAIDAFEIVGDINRPWHKPLVLEGLSPKEVSDLINALLDRAGRAGRRRNNR